MDQQLGRLFMWVGDELVSFLVNLALFRQGRSREKLNGGTMENLFLLFLGATLLTMSGCHQRVDSQAARTEAKTVFNQMIQAWETKDMNLFAKITAHDADMVNFGTDAAERWVGGTL